MKLLLVITLFSHTLLAAERPVVPPMGESQVLTGNKPAVEFFKARLNDTSCRSDLAEAEKTEANAKADMDKALAKGEAADTLDALESAWRRDRKELLKLVERCGPCNTVPVKKLQIEGVARREVWYVAEGACQFVGDSRTGEIGFDAAWKSLLKVAGYGRKTGGFEPMLNFVPVDAKTGELRPNVTDIESFPFSATVGLKAGEFLGTTVAYRQFAELTWDEKKNGDRKTDVQVNIKTVTPPSGFKYPEVTDTWLSGRAKRVTMYPVSALQAAWYLNDQGYVRYYMAGEFGATIPFANESGRGSALEALYTLYRRAH